MNPVAAAEAYRRCQTDRQPAVPESRPECGREGSCQLPVLKLIDCGGLLARFP